MPLLNRGEKFGCKHKNVDIDHVYDPSVAVYCYDCDDCMSYDEWVLSQLENACEEV